MGGRFRAFASCLILLLVAVCSCQCNKPIPPPAPPEPAPPSDAPLAPEATPPPAESAPDQPPPDVDQVKYGAMDQYGQACAVLKWLKCPEADVADCASDMRNLVLVQKTFEPKNVTCIRQSRTAEKVRYCAVDCRREGG